ncbi:MAG: hypothetical protein K0U47_11200 [Epsilonproteobacteria bacterium]|nr:hypothetical protein [Campylobacterota bacterium]
MLKEISKKLTMKKTFFVTQLESFFNSIVQEYQEIINQKEIENSLLQEKIKKLEIDINNLVEIRNKQAKTIEIEAKRVTSLQEEVKTLRQSSNSSYNKSLAQENRELKKQLDSEEESEELQELKAKIKQLQSFISKGATAYSENLANQNSEKLIQEINDSLKK